MIKFALTAWAEALPGLAHCIYAVRAECMAALDHPILLSAAIAHLGTPTGHHASPLQQIMYRSHDRLYTPQQMLQVISCRMQHAFAT